MICSQTYGCSVVGVDLSTNMVGIAYERLLAIPDSQLKVIKLISISFVETKVFCLGLI